MKYLLFVFTLVLISPQHAAANWVQDGILIAGAPDYEQAVAATPDGAGGAFLAWMDLSTGLYDIYAQRLAPDGTEMWGPGGIVVCNAINSQWFPALAPDGAGGVVICWEDDRNGAPSVDIYGQRLDAGGNNLWTANGIPICNAANRQARPDVHFDGAAFLVAWEDQRAGLSDIYVQRVGLNGNGLWAANGVAAVNLINSTQSEPVVDSDGSSGAIVAWDDDRGGTNRVFVQAVNFFGTPAWGAGGVGVDLGGTQSSPAMIADGAGGVFVAWEDGGIPEVSLQRRDAAGAESWTRLLSAGERISMISDGAGGVIVAWDKTADVYAQRVTGAGAPLWQAQGTPVSTAALGQAAPELVADGAGGAIVVWEDTRFSDIDVYAQRITAFGAAMWTTDGVPVSAAPGAQVQHVVAGDGNGDVYIAWRDGRSGEDNIFAQRIEPIYGAWGQPEPAIAAVNDVPDDQGGNVAVNWYPSERDQFLYPEVTHYSIWRAVDAVTAAAMTTAPLADITPDFDQPVIRKEPTAAGNYFWEFLGTQIALRSSGYSYLAPTRDDSTSADPAVHYFQVVAHTSNANVFYVSDAVSGYSVDNLAPASPIMLTAQRVGNYVRLDWEPGTAETEPDFDFYAVYRDFGPGVVPEPAFYLSATADTTLWDPTVDPDRPYYYIVTAVDIHENQSDPSNAASVGATATGIDDTPALTSLMVQANYPNPFGGSTELRIGLPRASDVTVDVYDVAGRRVAGRMVRSMAAGWGAVPFDGHDTDGHALPSGVYFYRVRAGGDIVTRKMVIQR